MARYTGPIWKKSRRLGFSVLENGKFYIEEIIDSIGKIIEKEMGVRTAKVQSRIKKYTAKYNR